MKLQTLNKVDDIERLTQQFQAMLQEQSKTRTNAFEKTQLLSEYLFLQGFQMPPHNIVREMIGGGSNTSIVAAVNAAHPRILDAIKTLTVDSDNDVPAIVTSAALQLWERASTIAKHRADTAVAEQVSALQQQIAEQSDSLNAAQQQVTAAHAQLAQMAEQAAQDRGRCTALEESVAALEKEKQEHITRLLLLDSEQAHRTKEHQTAMQHAQDELMKALDRLEAMEARSLMDIDNAKQAAQAERQRMESHFQAERTEKAIEIARLERQMKESVSTLQVELKASQEEVKALLQRKLRVDDLAMLVRRLSKALPVTDKKDHPLKEQAMIYLEQHRLAGEPLR
jgi:chromosome segregation ATPase